MYGNMHNAVSVGGQTILSRLHGVHEMKKHKIAVALVCVVLFTGARRAIAASDEEQRASIPIESYAPADYFPEWYQPGDTIPYFSPDDTYFDCDSPDGDGRPDTRHTYLPAYGTWYWWLDVGRDWSWWDPGLNSYEWWLGGAPPPFPFPEGLTPRENFPNFWPRELIPHGFPYDPERPWIPPIYIIEPPPYSLPLGLTPWDNIPDFGANDPSSGHGSVGTEPFNPGVGVPEPGTLVPLISAGLCFAACAWRKRRRW